MAKLADPFTRNWNRKCAWGNSFHLIDAKCINELIKKKITLCFRGWSEIATFYWVRLAGLPCSKSRLQTCSIRTGISARGVGRGASPGGRTRRSSGWFHGLNTASRLHRVQVLALLVNLSANNKILTIDCVRWSSCVESEFNVKAMRSRWILFRKIELVIGKLSSHQDIERLRENRVDKSCRSAVRKILAKKKLLK